MKKDFDNLNMEIVEATETTEATGATGATETTEATGASNQTAPYLVAALYRSVAGHRTCLGTVEEFLDTSTGRTSVDSISAFEDKLRIAIESAMFQAISVGDMGDIEVEVDFNGIYYADFYSACNPATDADIQVKGLFGLPKDTANQLEARIKMQAEDCVEKVSRGINDFIVRDILAQK